MFYSQWAKLMILLDMLLDNSVSFWYPSTGGRGAGVSCKGLFTPRKSRSKSEKDQRTSKKDQRINDKHQRKFSLSHSHSLGLNTDVGMIE